MGAWRVIQQSTAHTVRQSSTLALQAQSPRTALALELPHILAVPESVWDAS